MSEMEDCDKEIEQLKEASMWLCTCTLSHTLSLLTQMLMTVISVCMSKGKGPRVL